MLKVISIEGPRGVGKSSVTRALRNSIEGATLINLTGFATDGADGLERITNYYDSLIIYLRELSKSCHEYIVIFDRIFFSESVYSELYKEYDSSILVDRLVKQLCEIADDFFVFNLFLKDFNILEERLKRDKILLFDKIEESIEQSKAQQDEYMKLYDRYNNHIKDDSLRLIHCLVDGHSIEELKEIIIKGVTV